MEYLADLGVFSGKVIVLTIAVGSLLVLLFGLIAKARKGQPLVHVELLNRRFDTLSRALKQIALDPKSFKADQKEAKRKRKAEASDRDKKRVYVLNFEGDIRASHVANLREEITAVISVARPGVDEVLVRLESRGGLVSEYGLAAAQMVRLRDAGIPVTACVDKVAASGGYMMACTANRIVAAPFAVLGSIGVLAQVPNLHRLIKKNDIDFEEFTGGEFKRTLTLLGEVTEKKRQKFHEQVQETHQLFKMFVHKYRPQVVIDEVATGEAWYGEQALAKRLADELCTSDDLLLRLKDSARLIQVQVAGHKKWSERLAENISLAIARTQENTWWRALESKIFS